MNFNRRNFIQTASLSVLGLPLLANGQQTTPPPQPKKAPFELAVASYTFREFDLAKVIEWTRRLNIKFVSLKEMHLPLKSTPQQIQEAVAKLNEAGIKLYAGGVIYMKTPEQVDQAFEYAKNAGFENIVGVPNHELLPLAEEKVKQYNIKLAIHNHGPGDLLYPTPASIIEKIEKLDSRIGICMDIGHTMRSGVDPAESTIQFKERILDFHFKDVSKADKSGSTVEIGRGVINIKSVVEALFKINYQGRAAFEHEKDGKDSFPGLAESVGYIRGMIAAL